MEENKLTEFSTDFSVDIINLVKNLKSNLDSVISNQIANIITSSRILCSVLLLFCPVFSASFYAFYVFGGFTDMIDGTVAKRTNSISNFGAKLDTIADIIFVFASLISVLPAIHMSRLLWIWCGIIAVIKISNTIGGIIRQKKVLTQHTIANKITGLFLFLLPLTLQFFEVQYSIPIVCTVATFSAIQEAHYISAGREII